MMIIMIANTPEQQAKEVTVYRAVWQIKIAITFPAVAKKINTKLLMERDDLRYYQGK